MEVQAVQRSDQSHAAETIPTGYEVDFYLREPRQLIQVVQTMENPAMRERVIQALLDAMRTLNLSSANLTL